MRKKLVRFYPEGSSLVNKSAVFRWVFTYAMRHSLRAAPLWKNDRQYFGNSYSKWNQGWWYWQVHSDNLQKLRLVLYKGSPSSGSYNVGHGCIWYTVLLPWIQIRTKRFQHWFVSWTTNTQGHNLDIQGNQCRIGEWWSHLRDQHQQILT